MSSQIIVTIPTTCLDDSIAFYNDILHFDLVHRFDRPGGVVLVFLNHKGFTVELVTGPHIPAGDIGSGAPFLTFMVSDLGEITSRLSAANIPVTQKLDFPDGVAILRFKDPNGALISFVSGEL